MSATGWQPTAFRQKNRSIIRMQKDLTPECSLELSYNAIRQEDLLSVSVHMDHCNIVTKHATCPDDTGDHLENAIPWAENAAREILRGMIVTLDVALDRLDNE